MTKKQTSPLAFFPTPKEQEERDLKDDMDTLDGTKAVGRLSCITLKRPSGGTVYLSGRPYLLTNYADRAYMIGEHTAHELIVRYPLVLKDAVVVPRER